MIRRLSLAFAFFTVLAGTAAPAFSDSGCMGRCGLTGKLTYEECRGVCGLPPTVKVK